MDILTPSGHDDEFTISTVALFYPFHDWICVSKLGKAIGSRPFVFMSIKLRGKAKRNYPQEINTLDDSSGQ